MGTPQSLPVAGLFSKNQAQLKSPDEDFDRLCPETNFYER